MPYPSGREAFANVNYQDPKRVLGITIDLADMFLAANRPTAQWMYKELQLDVSEQRSTHPLFLNMVRALSRLQPEDRPKVMAQAYTAAYPQPMPDEMLEYAKLMPAAA